MMIVFLYLHLFLFQIKFAYACYDYSVIIDLDNNNKQLGLYYSENPIQIKGLTAKSISGVIIT